MSAAARAKKFDEETLEPASLATGDAEDFISLATPYIGGKWVAPTTTSFAKPSGSDPSGTGLERRPLEADVPQKLNEAIGTASPSMRHRAAAPQLQTLQEFEGVVVSTDKDEFTAHLLDLTADDSTEQEGAVFSFSEVRDDDIDLIRNGAIFRWVIGYKKTSGTNERVSLIYFRRLPAISRRDIAAAKKSAHASGSIVFE